MLENTRIVGKSNIINSVNQASRNIARALTLFEEKKPNQLPHYFKNLQRITESILRGEDDAIWGLLSAIREMYPHTDLQNKTFFHLVNTGLPYTVDEIRKLEISLIQWLQSLGLIKSQNIATILDFEKEIRNGTLLCELAQIISNNKQPINGIFKDPKTDATAISNIRKALENLRKLSKISHK